MLKLKCAEILLSSTFDKSGVESDVPLWYSLCMAVLRKERTTENTNQKPPVQKLIFQRIKCSGNTIFSAKKSERYRFLRARKLFGSNIKNAGKIG